MHGISSSYAIPETGKTAISHQPRRFAAELILYDCILYRGPLCNHFYAHSPLPFSITPASPPLDFFLTTTAPSLVPGRQPNAHRCTTGRFGSSLGPGLIQFFLGSPATNLEGSLSAMFQACFTGSMPSILGGSLGMLDMTRVPR